MPEFSFIALMKGNMLINSLQEGSDSTMYNNSNVLNYFVTEPEMNEINEA